MDGIARKRPWRPIRIINGRAEEPDRNGGDVVLRTQRTLATKEMSVYRSRRYLHAGIQRFGSDIRAVRPDDGSDLWVHAYLFEVFDVSERLKHGTAKRA